MQVKDRMLDDGARTVCIETGGAARAPMDCGVPHGDRLAGVAAGAIEHGNRVAVPTDLLGAEDRRGDMYLKVDAQQAAAAASVAGRAR